MELEKRGSIAFFSTYRPPVPLDIFSCSVEPAPTSEQDETPMTDGDSSNYNGQDIPAEALKTLLRRPELASQGTEEEHVNSGMIFVSERDNLETLQIALRVKENPPKVKVFNLADVFGKTTFNGVRMEDSGCIAGEYLVYVTTKDPATYRRQPWTAVYKTNLTTGETSRLTPPGNADLSPSVSPSGKQIAVASFQSKGGWDGEIEDLQTDIYVMNIEKPFKRRLIIENGGWPTWGSEDVIFFHRKDNKGERHIEPKIRKGGDEYWAVHRFDISNGDMYRVTPINIHAVTPAAIDATRVAVATIRQKSDFDDNREKDQYRHIEIFDIKMGPEQSTRISQEITPKSDHFNPFVTNGGKCIGYHRCKNESKEKQFQLLDSPHPGVDLFRVSGVFPTFTKDGSRLAFVDNEFKNVWVADKNGLNLAYTEKSSNAVFSPVWNQNPDFDTLYVCVGPSFSGDQPVEIHQIPQVSEYTLDSDQLTDGEYNNAFPSTNLAGTQFVFRSKRENGYKNLWIMENAQEGEYEGNIAWPLTTGEWTDTHCQWSPHGDWIVFSSTRDKPPTAQEKDNFLDPGYFAVYLVNAKTRALVRVATSGYDIAGHVNHPFFSPDENSIVVTSDLAAVTAEPISLPLFSHSVRPYGDIFTIDIDLKDIKKSKNVKKFTRVTHSRYENSTATWTEFSTDDLNAKWNKQLTNGKASAPACPHLQKNGGQSWHMTGHLVIKDRCC